MPFTKSIQHAAWCDGCDNFEDYSEQNKPSLFKRIGWTEGDDGTCLCPKCSGKVQENTTDKEER